MRYSLRSGCGWSLRHSRAPGAFQDLRHPRVYGSMFGVSQPSKPRRPGPPHNPGVRDLVVSKRRWSSPPKLEDTKQGFRGWNERGYLPHRDEPGLTQFVVHTIPMHLDKGINLPVKVA